MAKAAKKINLSDLLDGKKGKANTDLYKEEPEKRKHHLRHRAVRQQLVTPKGGEYKRRLSGDAATDIRYYELAREFINNGFKQTKAYAAVFGLSISNSRRPASKVFNSAWMRGLLVEMMQGVDGGAAEITD